MSLLARFLLASVSVCIIVLLEDTILYGNSILSSGISPHKSVNFTLGNNTYLMINNKTGNFEMLFVNNANSDKIFDKLINSDNNTDNQDWQADIVVPISVAIIGAIAASWSFFQARWNGRYFQKLILEELGEFQPDIVKLNGTGKINGNLQSYMEKQFIHKNILDNPSENKEFIFNTNHHLIYLTTQLWNAFINNDGKQFLFYFCSIAKERKFKVFKKYDRKDKIEKACKKWMKLITKDYDSMHINNINNIIIPENCDFKSVKIKTTFSYKGEHAHQSTLDEFLGAK